MRKIVLLILLLFFGIVATAGAALTTTGMGGILKKDKDHKDRKNCNIEVTYVDAGGWGQYRIEETCCPNGCQSVTTWIPGS